MTHLPTPGLVAAVVERGADVVDSHFCEGRRITLLPHTGRNLHRPSKLVQDSPPLQATATASVNLWKIMQAPGTTVATVPYLYTKTQKPMQFQAAQMLVDASSDAPT